MMGGAARVVSEDGERRKGRGEEAEHVPSRKVRSSLPKLELGLRARVGFFPESLVCTKGAREVGILVGQQNRGLSAGGGSDQYWQDGKSLCFLKLGLSFALLVIGAEIGGCLLANRLLFA